MDEDKTTFPMDVTDPSSRPWKFRPQGYLVVILADTDEAKRAETALVGEGFAHQDIKLYTGKQILENHEEYIGRRGSKASTWTKLPSTARCLNSPTRYLAPRQVCSSTRATAFRWAVATI